MIGLICGSVEESKDGKVTVGVSHFSEENKIGYLIHTPQSYSYSLFQSGQKIRLWIHTHVREDAFQLYGFLTLEERDIFLLLLTVSGIGPKGALSILTKVELATLFDAILSNNKDVLTEIPGIGKKIAERITTELCDSLRKKIDKGEISFSEKRKSSQFEDSQSQVASTKNLREHLNQFTDAKMALMGLGYREQEISFVLKKIQEYMNDRELHCPNPQ